MKTFQSIKYWIFDLDNTLYSGKTKVFEQVEKKMSKYVSDKLDVNIDEAKKIQKNYFHEYNTTLNGMIKNHKINANEFLEFVHDIDIDFLNKDLKLSEELKKLNGKKIIFTNGPRKHAINVTQRIGIGQYFDDIFDIVDSEFIPKPHINAYKKMIKKFNIDPKKSIFIEDIAHNLEAAKNLGMKTCWLENDDAFARKDANKSYIDYKIKSLPSFLQEINVLKAT